MGQHCFKIESWLAWQFIVGQEFWISYSVKDLRASPGAAVK